MIHDENSYETTSVQIKNGKKSPNGLKAKKQGH